MRHFVHKIVLSVAALLIMAVPVLAEEGTLMPGTEPQQSDKDECLLMAMNCANQVDSFQERIGRIQNEINKGTDVYTNEELKVLQNKLDDVKRNFDNVIGGA